MITEKGDVTTSFLLIQNASLADSGRYSCSPSNADVASVRVHVLNGKIPLLRNALHASACYLPVLTLTPFRTVPLDLSPVATSKLNVLIISQICYFRPR